MDCTIDRGQEVFQILYFDLLLLWIVVYLLKQKRKIMTISDKQPLDVLNTFIEEGELFNAREEHYVIAQNILKSGTATPEQINAATQACMSFINKSRSTRIDSDVVRVLKTF